MHHLQPQKTRKVAQCLVKQPLPIDRSRHEVRAIHLSLRCDGKQEAIEQYDAAIQELLTTPIRRFCNGTIIEQYFPQTHIAELELLILDLIGLLNNIPMGHDSIWEGMKQKAMQQVAALIHDLDSEEGK